jgi:outer membrane lipoprotein-sorting protein
MLSLGACLGSRKRLGMGGLLAVALSAVASLAAGPTGPAGPAAASDPRDPRDPRALALVRAYNARNFGNPGWRRVHLELKSGETVTRSFDIVNLWLRSGAAVRTLFVLERPATLQGTDYLLVEDPADPSEMKVFLHLPAGQRRVLSIQPSGFGEGLLGSDFGYGDLRLLLPVDGYDYRSVGRQTLLGESVWAVDAVPTTSATAPIATWARARLYFLERAPMLLGTDSFANAGDRQPAKRMRVLGFKQVDGAWTETRIAMTAAEGHSSVLTLSDFRPSVPAIERALFEPQALPSAAERLGGAGLFAGPRGRRDETGGR